MSRYIDAERLYTALEQLYKDNGWERMEVHFSLSDMECNIHFMPTANVRENVNGKWEVTGERKFVALDGSAEKQYRELGYPHHNVLNMRCSNCNMTTMVDASIAYGYCPHCGARMEGADE